MRDVAALAGVSVKTVSRVVNDEVGVKDAVRVKVRAALTRLDYRPNLAASNLRRGGGRTATIGVLVQDVSNTFSAALLRALEDSGRTRGIAVLAASLDEEPDRERALVADLVARRVDGLVLMPASSDQEYLAVEIRAGLPIVFVDREPRGILVDSVTVDNVLGGRLAVQHLLAGGHRRIAFLGDLDSIQTARRRRLGFEAELREAGPGVRADLVCTGLRDGAAAYDAVTRMLTGANPPTALFAGRNTLTIGAVRALRDLRRHDDVALVGFDDFPLAELMTPALTVIRQDVARIGAAVSERLFDRLDGDRTPARDIVLDPVLVARGSGEIRPLP